MGLLNRIIRMACVAVVALVITPVITTGAYADGFEIKEAKWDDENNRIKVKGNGRNGRTVTVTNADTGAPVGTDVVDDDEWRVRQYNPSSIPCRVRAEQSGGRSAEKNVEDAPSNCDDGGSTPPPGGGGGFQDQTDYKIMMNYELGMHCTGFEFAYCCVLPAYNSILAQVVKPEGTDGSDFPELLEGDPNEGLDGLGRETVVRDKALDGSGNFKKYVLKYWHDAQPRNDGRGKAQTSTLISAVEGNSLLSWNTTFDSVALNADGTFVTGSYNGADDVMLGNNTLGEGADNYQNAIWNHLYFYDNLEGDGADNSVDANKTRLGVNGHVVYPPDCGAALHPMGPVTTDPADPTKTVPNDCGGFSNGNVLTFSGSKGTVVYTQMKVLENLPVMLTSPDIWESLGLPLTTFEDSIDFFSDPGLVDEDSVRPFVAMKAQMYEYDGGANSTAVLDSNGDPVIGFGTAPIDIPNCERCHSNDADGTQISNPANEGGGTLIVDNSPNNDPAQYALVKQEYDYWNAYYFIDKAAGDSDWYSRLKSAAISMLNGHDLQHGTSFAANYPGTDVPGELPQNTRLGHESVICQRCHADNVIAAVKSATKNGVTIKPITEAIHNNHRGISSFDSDGNPGPIAFTDSEGRDGGCQGCHPAHRSDGDMDGYPITLAGTNRYANGDNRGANGGCFVGRDVHSNPGKDSDGAGTPEHLNAAGQWLASNVSNSPTENTGIWCTNCHNQLGQELWKTENMDDLVHGVGLNNPRGASSLAAMAAAVGVSEAQAESWLDPKDSNPVDDTYTIWDPLPEPGLCAFLVDPSNPANDGNVATIEVSIDDDAPTRCTTGEFFGPVDCSGVGGPIYNLCGTYDADGDFSVNAMDFCTTSDCVAAAQAKLSSTTAVPVPFSAATDGRDHWLSAGEPHCADCHEAPYVEQSGNINAYPPFNYPRKASLMRYSRGHQDISCQGCHESIHGLYPVTPLIDTTSYAQAAALNHDGSHGPLKCGTCHEVGGDGIPDWVDDLEYNGQQVKGNFDRAVSWMHTFTAEADPRKDVCLNCHHDEADEVSWRNDEWTEHAMKGRTSRQTMDTVEALENINMSDPRNTLCESCHGDEWREVSCGDHEWKEHLTEGRVSEEVWVNVSQSRTGSTCGW